MTLSSLMFGFLGVQLVVWFGLCHRMFRLLATRHPETYEAMGKPRLFMNNTLSNNIAFMRFFYGRGYVALQDPVVSKLAAVMWLVSFTYVSTFILMFYVGK